MTLVILNSTVAVNPSQVVSVVIDTEHNRVVVEMKNGRGHSLPCEYGKSIFLTRDDLVKRINGEAE